jgi:hypothetical protein
MASAVALAIAGPSFASPAMTGAPVTMHAAPSGKSPVVQRIPANARIDLSTCERGWCRASWRNLFGYIPAEIVVVSPPRPAWAGNDMPPPAVYPPAAALAPPPFRWTGPYIGTNFGYGATSW